MNDKVRNYVKEAKKYPNKRMMIYLSEDSKRSSFIGNMDGCLEIIEISYYIDFEEIHLFGSNKVENNSIPCKSGEEIIRRLKDESFYQFDICSHKKYIAICEAKRGLVMTNECDGCFYVAIRAVEAEACEEIRYYISFKPQKENEMNKIQFFELDENTYQLITEIWRKVK